MDFLHKLLNYFHIEEGEFAAFGKTPSFSDLPDISASPCVKKAIDRLNKAKERNERILIYGDYDCDGVMSASIIKKAFREYGLSAEAYLPSRYLDGYGLNVENVMRIAASYSLIFTVDNGVAAKDAIQKANEKNIDVIVLDHHEYVNEPEGIVALIHPRTLALEHPSISAGFLSYLFSVALLKRQDPYFEMLGALSLLSDAMEMASYNRLAVGLALSLWKKEGNIAFSRLQKGEGKDEQSLQMQIIPTINSIGRLNTGSKINRLIKYFTEPESEEAALISSWMLALNQERKDLISLSSSALSFDPSKPAIFYESSLPEGINGLLANRIMEQANRPVAVFSPSDRLEGVYVGSMRSKEGCPLGEFFQDISSLLVAGGGHAYAAGFSVRKEDLAAFEERFLSYAASRPFSETKEEAIPVSLGDINADNYRLLRLFGPFGMGNCAPLFSVEVDASTLRFSPDQSRLSTYLGQGVRLFSFRYGKKDFPEKGIVTLHFRLNENVYRGKSTISADVTDVIF